MRVKKSQDLPLQSKLRIDRDMIISKSSKRLLKPICKFVKLMIKINKKMYKSKTYNKAINNPIHRNR